MSRSEAVNSVASGAPFGIFGGTFDPVHLGHLRLAEEAREVLGLSRVLWIPAGQPPLRDVPQTSALHRLAMVEQAIAGNSAFALDATEVSAAQASYTVNTLQRLRAEHGPQQSLVLLLGADAFAGLERWFEWQRLFELAHIGVATRPGHDFAKPGAGPTQSAAMGPTLAREFQRRQATPADLTANAAGAIVPFVLTALDISATAIRGALGAGRSARYLLSNSVLDYIQHHHLYR